MTVAFRRIFGILERWNNNQVTLSLSKPHIQPEILVYQLDQIMMHQRNPKKETPILMIFDGLFYNPPFEKVSEKKITRK